MKADWEFFLVPPGTKRQDGYSPGFISKLNFRDKQCLLLIDH